MKSIAATIAQGLVRIRDRAQEAPTDVPDLALNDASDLICVTDLVGRLQYVNRASERVLGIPPRELIGTSLTTSRILTTSRSAPRPSPGCAARVDRTWRRTACVMPTGAGAGSSRPCVCPSTVNRADGLHHPRRYQSGSLNANGRPRAGARAARTTDLAARAPPERPCRRRELNFFADELGRLLDVDWSSSRSSKAV